MTRAARVTAVGAALALTLCAVSRGEEPPINVLLIVADDLGYMDIGANNPGCFYDTPHLDRLAREGTRFTQGYAANPVCSPTRYGVATGKHPTRAAATNYFTGRKAGRFRPATFEDRMAVEEVTLAERLRDAGYRTFFAGKWHLGPTEEFWPEAQGYDVNRGGHQRGGPYGGDKYFSPYGNPRLEDGPAGEHLPDRLAAETIAFIEADRERPFFAHLSFYSVHTPLMAPDDLVAKYEAKAESIPGEAFAEEEQNLPIDTPRRVRVLQRHAVYAAMVEAMDRAIGRVLTRLDDLGLADDTLVLFTSDNGGLSTSEGHPTSNLPLRGGKGWVYEGGIRVPYVARWPGVAASVRDEPVTTLDVVPTVLGACGVPVPDGLDGEDLGPIARGEPKPERDLFWHYPHYSNQGGFPGGAIRDGRFKLIERYEDGRVHLYDLDADVGEQRDLAEEMPDRVEAMRERLHAWYEEVDARFLRPRGDGGPAPWQPGR